MLRQNLCPHPNWRQTSGFTLVELVMVLILIGVISALGIGLFASRSTFSPLLASQQFSSAVLLAQQAGLAGNTTMNVVTIDEGADTFTFDVGAGSSFELERAGTSLAVSGATLPLTITFDDSGYPSSGQRQFTFTGESTYRVCLSSLGAIYQGVCQ